MSAIDIHIPTIPPQHFGNVKLTAEWVSVHMITGIDAGKASRADGRAGAWSQYVKAMGLRPQIDAKDFYKMFDKTWDFIHRPGDVIPDPTPKPKPKPKSEGSKEWVKVESVDHVMRVNPRDRNDNSIYFSVNGVFGRKYVVKGSIADNIEDFYQLRGIVETERKETISGQLNRMAQKVIDKITGKTSTPKIVAPKPQPATNLPPALTAPPELTADVLGVGPTQAAPKRKPAAKPRKTSGVKYTKFSMMGKGAYRVRTADMTDYEDMSIEEGGAIIHILTRQQSWELSTHRQCELTDAQSKEIGFIIAARSSQNYATLIQRSIKNGTHNGYVRGKTYYALTGYKIAFGDYIDLHFRGDTPAGMHFPLKLVSAKNHYSTAEYKTCVEVVVKDANGVKYSFMDAHLLSPSKGEPPSQPPHHTEKERKQPAKRKPAPTLPPILTAPPELTADVLGTGPMGLTPTPTTKPKRKPAPAPTLPPALTAPPELTADVFDTGPMGLTPTPATPKARKPKARKPKTKVAAAPKAKPKATKPKAKKTAAAQKLTAAQREHLAIQGFVMVRRGGKYVKITG